MSEHIFVINGFYMAMREKYTNPSASLAYFTVEWDEDKLSWADFRGKVLGATDPTTAASGSLRRIILEQYKELGLSSEPNVGDNGVHASASPFEALSERMNWVGASVDKDEFAQALFKAGISADDLKAWTKDPQVTYEGQKGSLFDNLEDLNASECLAKAQKIAGASGSVDFKKNMAFVFIKPHAVTPKVIELVKKGLADAGITITSEGKLDGKKIESDLLIDNHYYAIANKAALTKPKDLNPPAAKQEDFQKLFGLSWSDALAQNLVFNAVDACAHWGISGDAMDSIWAKAKKSDQLVKFGGGFYCGKVVKESPESIYVINGFYMAMREKYTSPSASIAYFTVEWDEDKLSWADFRGKVLGATDPTTAAAGSLRRIVLEQYKELGLSSEPNVGDNGIHASASPFEAMAERLNWVGAKVADDEFAQALLAAGVSEADLLAWTKDPQVTFEGNKGSLFDNLEDLNASECLAKAQKIAGASGPINLKKNMAFVFVKPHAVTPKVVDLVKSTFAKNGINITKEGTLDGKTIESQQLIDNHYYAIANKAALTKPKDLNPPAAKQAEFESMFGLSWPAALEKNLVFNAVDACARLGISGDAMDAAWAKTKKANLLVKFGGGFYCGKVTKQ